MAARLILFIKSYSRDLDRTRILIESIYKFNRDSLPVVLVVPKLERVLFEEKVGKMGITYLNEEDFPEARQVTQGWLKQQIIKLTFHSLGIADHYVVLDSDDCFIRDFSTSDFIAPDGRPYFIVAEAKERSRIALRILSQDEKFATMFDRVRKEKERIRSAFGATHGRCLYFQPAPIFVTKLLREFTARFLVPQYSNFEKMLRFSPFEADWIGEWIYKNRLQSVAPCEPMFLELQRSELLDYEKSRGVSLAELSQFYLGVRLCSGWNDQMTWEPAATEKTS